MNHMNPQNFTSEDEAALRETLKRCSPETIEKAVELRKTGNAELAGTRPARGRVALNCEVVSHCSRNNDVSKPAEHLGHV